MSLCAHCVVIGAGHAAAQLCASLRELKWPGQITLVGDEALPPYHRPPLSKSQLDPALDCSPQLIRPAEFYTRANVRLLLGTRATHIDPRRQLVRVGDTELHYDSLVLATGSRHVRPSAPGMTHPRVFTLCTAADAQAVRGHVANARRVAIVGSGFIALESAAALRKLGLEVVLLARGDRLLSRVTSPPVSSFFAKLHQAHGVAVRFGSPVAAVDEEAGQLVLRSEHGACMCEADFVVVGIGARPNDELARDAGLSVDHGILVDEHNRTSDPAIFAIGDCCAQVHPLYQTRLRLECVQNATDQAKVVASAIAGAALPAATLPWFWSDQYDVKLQMAGVSSGYEQLVVRGKAEPGQSFSVWYWRGGRLLAADAVNDPRAYVVASKLILRGATPAPDVLADVQRDLKDLLNWAPALGGAAGPVVQSTTLQPLV